MTIIHNEAAGGKFSGGSDDAPQGLWRTLTREQLEAIKAMPNKGQEQAGERNSSPQTAPPGRNGTTAGPRGESCESGESSCSARSGSQATEAERPVILITTQEAEVNAQAAAAVAADPSVYQRCGLLAAMGSNPAQTAGLEEERWDPRAELLAEAQQRRRQERRAAGRELVALFRRAGPAARRRLVRLLVPELRALVRETFAADLPAALDALQPRPWLEKGGAA
jgi:hypothetical protein